MVSRLQSDLVVATDVRVLIVNVALAGDRSGTGHTLGNLFANCPQGNMMQLSLQLEPSRYRTIVENTEFLDEQSIGNYLAFRKAARRLGIFSKSSTSGPGSVLNAVPQSNFVDGVRSAASGLMDMIPCRLSARVMRSIREFGPNVIYTCGSSIRVHSVVNSLARELGIPVVLHLMDDWPETVYRSTFLSRVPRTALLRELKLTNRMSSVNFAISEPLCSKYEARYDRHYLQLMNPAMCIVERVTVRESEPVRFLYAGSIGIGRRQALVDVSRAVALLNHYGTRAQLILHIPDDQNRPDVRQEFDRQGATVRPYLPPDELRVKYDEADVLVHVESFVSAYSEFTRLSLSTKIPEYMGLGKPILAYLPRNLYASRYIGERGCGVVSNDAASLIEGVSMLAGDSALRATLAARGLEAAKREHAAPVVQGRLRQTLAAVALTSRARNV